VGEAVTIKACIKRGLACENGATAIEYALVVGIISTALVSIAATGGAVQLLYDRLMQIAAAFTG
jgi:Flp pilus assembly pilin Flp